MGRLSPAIDLERLAAYRKAPALKFANLIAQFINSERFHSEVVNHNNPKNKMLGKIKFGTPVIAEVKNILLGLKNFQNGDCEYIFPYERIEEPCNRKYESRSHSTADAEIIADASANTDTSSISDVDDNQDSLSTKMVKLYKPDVTITKMQQRRESTTKVTHTDEPKDYIFDEPKVTAIDSLDTDEEGIVVNKLQREDTSESLAQSDTDVIIGSDKNYNFPLLDIDIDEAFLLKGSFKRLYTIADDNDTKLLLKNVTIDESLCLDEETSANIRRKMMASSLSLADSDYSGEKCSLEPKTKNYDDFNVSTALIQNSNSSTETESTTVSAATKIQAAARGYLTRKHLGRCSITSDGKSLPCVEPNKASFGNAAITESLEHLVQESAAKKIQEVFRKYYKKKFAKINKKVDSLSPEIAISVQNSLAKKRTIMLQRGVALSNNSTLGAGNSSSSSGGENTDLKANIDENPNNLVKQHLRENVSLKDSLNITSKGKGAADICAKKIEENKMKWLSMRQNSMPVQIDSEVLRIIPKLIRKNIKSADCEKRKNRQVAKGIDSNINIRFD